ncbi:MAG: flagellar basal body P-ring protein FlgI [Planctomycetia bacterium]|nr:flagellar basal body P-ring protein FlgI [Planctomycetia bacterium]
MRQKILFLCVTLWTVSLFVGGISGCKSKTVRSQNPEGRKASQKAFFVGDETVPDGFRYMEIQSVSLATNLAGTGSNPPESTQRTMLLREMASQGVPNPQKILADSSTSLVVVKGYLPPAVKKGDRFDVEVCVPSDSETTSLRGGYLLEAPMRGIYNINGANREGKKMGICRGPILVEPRTGTDRDKRTQIRGKVLGGGIATTDSILRLRIVSESTNPDRYQTMKMESAINHRFQIPLPGGGRENVAKAKTDKYLELKVHPKYKDNPVRFVEVVRCIPIYESEAKRLERMATLEKRLMNPTTAKRAAMELEAIGKASIDTLKAGLQSSDVIVRFYAAQSLAFLDESEAAQVLGQVALTEHAYRGYALSALSALNDLYAYEELRKLMNAPTAEARYGAFRALKQMRPDDPLVKGEMLGDDTFNLCVVPCEGKPMLHVTKNKRAEIVLFGVDQQFRAPLVVEGTNNIVVRANGEGNIVISRFIPGRPDQRRTVSMKVDEVIRALSDIGATYPDVIEILQSAISQNALDSAFRIDAIPSMRRQNEKEQEAEDKEMR